MASEESPVVLGDEKITADDTKKKKKQTAKDEAAKVSAVSAPEVVTVADLADQVKESTLTTAAAGAVVAATAASRGAANKVPLHKFWDTQPVPKLDAVLAEKDVCEAIEANKPREEVRQEPFRMPEGFGWSALDVTDESVLQEIYTLLNENYVEDDDAMFRFDYSMPFLQWALTPPNFEPSFHLGVRNDKAGSKLMAFITGVPAVMQVKGKPVRTVEINFLCVHKKLRTKRLAPVLIKEITRRVNLAGIFQAVYTAGVVLPKPIASCRYYHRSLEPKKLIEIGFSRLMPRMTMARTIKLYKLPDNPVLPGIRAMTKADIPSAHALLNEYLKKFKLAPNMAPDEMEHWLLPRPGVVDSYVICDAKGKVTDMCSFYHLPSTVIGHDKHNTLSAAYSFYNVATSVPLVDLMRDALTCARKCGLDVFNALNIMENDAFLKDLKFGIGDGHLQYYLYNWRCADMTPQEIGLVLL